MDAEGHQIGSHTWSHADLATLDAAGITSQMTQLETALTSILGKVPTYMRPPYFSTNALALSTLGGLGYHVINANIDTLDYEHDDDTIGVAFTNFQNGLASGGTISLMHDVHAQTVHVLVQEAINAIKAKGLTRKFLLLLRRFLSSDKMLILSFSRHCRNMSGRRLCQLVQVGRRLRNYTAAYDWRPQPG